MSTNAELHSKVIEVVEKPSYSMATVGAANSDDEAIEEFLFGPDCIMEWWERLKTRDSHVMATRILLEGLSQKHVNLRRRYMQDGGVIEKTLLRFQ